MPTRSKALSFPAGGVHPDGDKDRTRSLPLHASAPPAEVAVLMVQHIGAPAMPSVKKSDHVRMGQIIGQAGGYVSANVHAPVSGVVKAVEPRISCVTGTSAPAVIIENDGEDAWDDGLNEPQDVEAMDPARMVELVQECGVVGMGGATFPAHVKLSPPKGMEASDVLINGAECEPSVTVDHRLMVERADEILDGLKLIMEMVGAENGCVGIELNKPNAIEALESAARGDARIRVVPLEVKYPQGAEQQLITAVTGREVPSGGGLPGHVGCLVHNVATVLAIRDAVRFRRPLVERPLTITGDAVEQPGNYIERIGADAAGILERQGVLDGANQLIMGGPMMGIAQASLSVPLVKGSNCLLLRRAGPPPQMRDCIRCGRCVEHCPLGLMPGDLSIACEQHDWDAALALNLNECKECGGCAYVCPARRHIVHLIKLAKAEVQRLDAMEKAG